MEKTIKYKEYFSGGAEIYGSTVDDLYLAKNDLELEETVRNEVFFCVCITTHQEEESRSKSTITCSYQKKSWTS
uniref:Uncharacterized protein n=1 Tax=Arundo donax TaxID=35708 RepID=A0A0A9FCC8_ARUDO